MIGEALGIIVTIVASLAAWCIAGALYPQRRYWHVYSGGRLMPSLATIARTRRGALRHWREYVERTGGECDGDVRVVPRDTLAQQARRVSEARRFDRSRCHVCLDELPDADIEGRGLDDRTHALALAVTHGGRVCVPAGDEYGTFGPLFCCPEHRDVWRRTFEAAALRAGVAWHELADTCEQSLARFLRGTHA